MLRAAPDADPLVRGSAADSARGRDRLHHRPRAAGRVPRRHRRVGQQRELGVFTRGLHGQSKTAASARDDDDGRDRRRERGGSYAPRRVTRLLGGHRAQRTVRPSRGGSHPRHALPRGHRDATPGPGATGKPIPAEAALQVPDDDPDVQLHEGPLLLLLLLLPSRAAATTTTTSTTAPSQSRQLALPAASGDVHATAEDSSNDSSSSSSSPLESHSTSGLRRRRNARASGDARSPGHALRDAVERVARELGVNVDRSTSGSSAASAAAWDDELEDGSPSPEALRARMSFLAETMTSVLREFDARLQRVAGAGAGGTRMLGDGGKWPASREDVDALPTRTVSVSETELCRGCADGHHDDDEQGPQCYICLGEYEAGETLRTLPCGHAFHAPCVDKWLLEQRRACPTCRATVPAVKKATPCVASSRPFVYRGGAAAGAAGSAAAGVRGGAVGG